MEGSESIPELTPADPGATKPPRESAGPRTRRSRRGLLAAAAALVAVVALVVVAWPPGDGGRSERAGAAEEHDDEHDGEVASEVALSPEALAAAGITTEEVRILPAAGFVRVPGHVDLNQEQTESVTPLVSGRVERVLVSLGDRVAKGAVLAVVSSPQIAQLHGKLHEAETRAALAERNLERVLRSENRGAVIAAKARLDEAETTLARIRKLADAGVVADSSLTSAETAYRTAKAEFDFESNIALNKEVQEARSELETARVDATHIRDEIRALGAEVPAGEHGDHGLGSSLVALRAPLAGVVTERLVNAGAGVEAGRSVFTVSNLSTVWVIASVPERMVSGVREGFAAEVRGAALGQTALTGRIAYVGARLDEATRTAPVRVLVDNHAGLLKAGMFVEVGFEAGLAGAGGPAVEELAVPEAAVQQIRDRTVVFVPEEAGRFAVRDVEVGGASDGYRRVLSGLGAGERVVTRGAFTLKTQLMRGELGDHDH